MERTSLRARSWPFVVAAGLLSMSACGQAAPNPAAPGTALDRPVATASSSPVDETSPGSTPTASSSSGGGSSPAQPPGTGGSPGPLETQPAPTPDEQQTFSWSLPGGDLSVDAIGDVFNSLVAGRCEEALTDLDIFLVNDPVWTDGQEQLYRAAIATCSGDLATAQGHLSRASLTRHPGDCRLYKAVVSVLEQRSQDTVTCPAPQLPSTTPSETGDPGPPTSEEPGATTSVEDTTTDLPAEETSTQPPPTGPPAEDTSPLPTPTP